jgi:hypothetical protein
MQAAGEKRVKKSSFLRAAVLLSDRAQSEREKGF